MPERMRFGWFKSQLTWQNGLKLLPILATAWWIWDTIDIPIYWLAITWTVGAFYGAGATLMNAVETWQERQALKNSQQRDDRAMAQIANANVRREIFRLIGYLAIIAIGVMVLTSTTNALVARSMLVILVASLIINSLMDRHERSSTRQLFKRRR